MDVAFQRYVQAMPQYQEPLDLLQRILDFQATLADRLELALHVEPDVAREKWRVGRPLFAGESLPISAPLFREALADLRSVLSPGEPAQVALDHLLASSYLTSSKVETLLGDLVADSDASIQRLADATSTDPDILAFVLRTVLSPFFKKRAAPYQEWVETAAWRRGVCPMCGSEPWMARLTHQEGRRILACSLCRTEWTFDRLRCPFCESDGQPLLRYFAVDDDAAHRVDCCDRCQRYVKTVDERVSGRLANLPVEDVITAHLDALAGELGYQ
jgi:FdhE protein